MTAPQHPVILFCPKSNSARPQPPRRRSPAGRPIRVLGLTPSEPRPHAAPIALSDQRKSLMHALPTPPQSA
jgi:hypothetical protein